MKKRKRCLCLHNVPDTDRQYYRMRTNDSQRDSARPLQLQGRLSARISGPRCSQGDNSLLAAQQGGRRDFEAVQL